MFAAMLQAGRDPCRVGAHPSVTPEPSTTGHPSLSCSPQLPWAVNVNHSRTRRCLQPGLCLFIPFVICCFHKHQLCQEWHVRHPRLLQNLRSNSWYNCGWGKGQYRCVGPWWVKCGGWRMLSPVFLLVVDEGFLSCPAKGWKLQL